MKKWFAGIAGLIGIACLVFGIIIRERDLQAISIIGGADGPTAIFVAGKVGGGTALALIVAGALAVLLAALYLNLRRKK